MEKKSKEKNGEGKMRLMKTEEALDQLAVMESMKKTEEEAEEERLKRK